MPRKFKKDRTSRKLYSDKTLADALCEIKDGNLTMTQAAHKYGIPLTTISRKMKQVNHGQMLTTYGSNVGSSKILSLEQERMLARDCLEMFGLGSGFTRFVDVFFIQSNT